MHVSILPRQTDYFILGVLPFADLTLLTSNAATGIMVSAFLSITFLGEKFVWKYDLTAVFLIVTGSVLIIIQSDLQEKSMDSQEVALVLTSTKGIVFIICAWILHATTFLMVLWMLKKVSEFESDCERWLSR